MKPNTSPPAHSDSDDDSIDIPRGRSSTAVTEEGVVYRTASHVSGPDAIEAADPHHDDDHGDDASGSKPRSRSRSRSGGRDPYREAGDEVYERHSRWRKVCIVGVLSFCAFLSPISSTSVLSATPEVAATYGTTGSIINLSNAGYMALMAVSPVIWGPISQVFGRRPVSTPLSLQLEHTQLFMPPSYSMVY